MWSLTWKWKRKLRFGSFYAVTMWFTIFYCIVEELCCWNIEISIIQNPEIAASQKYEWTPEGKIQWVEGIFPDNIKRILAPKEHDDQESWINVILEKFNYVGLYFLKIHLKVARVVNIKFAFTDWQFCNLIILIK